MTEKWYKKSLAINEKLGNEHGAASTCGQMGLLEVGRKRFVEAGGWLIKSIERFGKARDEEGVRKGIGNFLGVYKAAPGEDKKRLKAMFAEAGLGDIDGTRPGGPG